MPTFLAELKRQRWDDHRYYHHCRINQSLHLLSALSFLASYVLIFTNVVAAVLIGWLAAMVSRQVGHFFFEPKGYDSVNQTTHEHKEQIKVGYNLRRKVVLLSLWGISPFALWLVPALYGSAGFASAADYLRRLCEVWLGLGIGALLFRTGQLFLQQGLLTGVVWLTKILTDPFHDIMLYWRAPLHLLRGELIDPMDDVVHRA